MTIRRQPQDFEVEEHLVPAWRDAIGAVWSPNSTHALFRLAKSGLTTPDAMAHMCKALRIAQNSASYAGLKDKHAATAQHVTVAVKDAQSARAMPETLEGSGWRIHRIGWCGAPIDASAIAGNEFTIVVRALKRPGVEAMDRAIRALTAGAHEQGGQSLLVVNYFGAQRFGSARHGKGFAAVPLIAGDFTGAIRLLVGTPTRKDSGRTRTFTRLCAMHWGDWKRLARELPPGAHRAPFEKLASGATDAEAFQALPPFLQGMCIEAFQSAIWNETARNMVRALGVPVHESEDDFGALLFVAAEFVPESWRTLGVPLLSPETAWEGAWTDAASAALKSYGLALADLKVPGVRRPFFGHAVRPLVVPASAFSAGAAAPDEFGSAGQVQRTVRFHLPRGAYATVVLRALGS